MQGHWTKAPAVRWNLRVSQCAYRVVGGCPSSRGHAVERPADLTVGAGEVEVDRAVPNGHGNLDSHLTVQVHAIVVQPLDASKRALRQRAQRLPGHHFRWVEQRLENVHQPVHAMRLAELSEPARAYRTRCELRMEIAHEGLGKSNVVADDLLQCKIHTPRCHVLQRWKAEAFLVDLCRVRR